MFLRRIHAGKPGIKGSFCRSMWFHLVDDRMFAILPWDDLKRPDLELTGKTDLPVELLKKNHDQIEVDLCSDNYEMWLSSQPSYSDPGGGDPPEVNHKHIYFKYKNKKYKIDDKLLDEVVGKDGLTTFVDKFNDDIDYHEQDKLFADDGWQPDDDE